MPIEHPVTVRPAAFDDCQPVALMLTELGYPATPAQVLERLTYLAASPADYILVAELEGQVAGVASVHILPYFQSGETVCRLSALVIKEEHRDQGVGSALLAAVEKLAQSLGCQAIELTSAERRLAAHAFYERRGYHRAGIKFFKLLE